MKSPLAEDQRAALIEAMLPSVPFDGWSRLALRSAARRVGLSAGEALALFPNGAAELVACFSRWVDLRMLDRLETTNLEPMRIAQRVALAIAFRLEILAPWREAVRRALSVLALPQHAPLGLRLLYETVDAIWCAAGDRATDFSFYTKRASLAAIYWSTRSRRAPTIPDTGPSTLASPASSSSWCGPCAGCRSARSSIIPMR